MGTPLLLYNQAVATIADQLDNDLLENARLFALADLSMADAVIATWNAKYVYDFWRPITAIRNGEGDGNPDTAGDPNWSPLGAPGGGGGPATDFTPPFPSYVAGHSSIGAAAFQALADFVGRDQFKFTLTSDELPGVHRSYRRFSDASIENGISRIYLGIHWSFDDQQGQVQGRKIADFVFANYLRPLKSDGRRGDDDNFGSPPATNAGGPSAADRPEKNLFDEGDDDPLSR
jgi:hypothetical protein